MRDGRILGSGSAAVAVLWCQQPVDTATQWLACPWPMPPSRMGLCAWARRTFHDLQHHRVRPSGAVRGGNQRLLVRPGLYAHAQPHLCLAAGTLAWAAEGEDGGRKTGAASAKGERVDQGSAWQRLTVVLHSFSPMHVSRLAQRAQAHPACPKRSRSTTKQQGPLLPGIAPRRGAHPRAAASGARGGR